VTVKELIEQLCKFDQDANIAIAYQYDLGYIEEMEERPIEVIQACRLDEEGSMKTVCVIVDES
jgi:hypothetical protein